MWIGLAVLCVLGFLFMARRASETRSPDGAQGRAPARRDRQVSLKDDIDWEELERAEDEIRDVDPRANPEDGFEGDDWGPGAAPKPPLV
jgi:hypothetical protein